LIAMHYPEMWGIVQFTEKTVGTTSVAYVPDSLEPARWVLRQIYYAERNYHLGNGKYTAVIDSLSLDSVSLQGFQWPPRLEASTNLFQAGILSREGKLLMRIDQDGRLIQGDK
jgi:hypothetical protein